MSRTDQQVAEDALAVGHMALRLTLEMMMAGVRSGHHSKEDVIELVRHAATAVGDGLPHLEAHLNGIVQGVEELVRRPDE